MSFKQRLFRYLIGVTIGLLVTVVMFRDKLHLFTSWTPNNKVKERLEDSYWTVSPLNSCQLECLEMDVPEFKAYLQSADVDFGASQTKGDEKEYQLIFSESELLSSARFAVKDSSAKIVNLAFKTPCDCP